MKIKKKKNKKSPLKRENELSKLVGRSDTRQIEVSFCVQM